MNRRSALIAFAWAMAAAGALVLVTTAVAMRTPETRLSDLWVIAFGALGGDVVVFASVGAVLALRRPGNSVGVVLLASGPMIVLTFCGFLFGAGLTEARGPNDPLAAAASVVGGATIFPMLILVGPILALLFPDGRLPGPRWRGPAGAIGIGTLLGGALTMLQPGPISDGLANNPFVPRGTAWAEQAAAIGLALSSLSVVAALLLGVAAVVARFRRGRGVEREQLKWFLAANAVVVVLLLGVIGNSTQDVTPIDLLGFASLSLPPIAVGIAILRYRLYEIDRIISRTVSWAIVTALLVAVFAGAVVTLQALLAGFLQGQTLAVAASTLVAFALFQPLRRRVQHAVDRRFDRARYDGQRTVDAFAERLRYDVDLALLRSALVTTAGDAVRPVGAGVWLRRPAEMSR